MNTTTLAIIQPDELDTIQRTAKLLAASGYFATSEGIVGMAQVAAKIMAGRELALALRQREWHPHHSGKAHGGRNLMAAAVRAHPRYDYRVKELSDTACELEFFDNGKVAGVSRFTKAEAETAELSTGKNGATWRKFPRNMLFARAMSNGVRWYAPDIFSGNAVYVPEELGAEVDAEGNFVSELNVPASSDTKVVDTSPAVTEPAEPQHAKNFEVEFNPFESPSNVEAPTDEEHAILSVWQSPQDAYTWSVNVQACENEFEAKNSFKKSWTPMADD